MKVRDFSKRMGAMAVAVGLSMAMFLTFGNQPLKASTNIQDTSLQQTLHNKANTTSKLFAGGDGSITKPYQIATATQLEKIKTNLKANYILTADIDLSSYKNWIPIGNMPLDKVNMETGDMDMSCAFSGSFNGNGHKISNLSCKTNGKQVAVGLFGVSTGKISNLAVESIIVNGESKTLAAGGIAGYAISGEISRITLSGKNTLTGINCVGGIVGGSMAKVDGCTVEDATINIIGDNDFKKGIIQCDKAQCGGLIVGGSFTGSLDHCKSKGTINAKGNEAVGLGGIAGCIQCSPSITDNHANVTINTKNGHAIGGLCGYAGMGDDGDGKIDAPCQITNCSAEIQINTEGATHVGGLVGTGLYYYGMEDCYTIENCKVTGKIDGAVTPGTVAGRATNSKILSCDAKVMVDGKDSEQTIGTTSELYCSEDQYEEGSKEAAARLLDAVSGEYTEYFPIALEQQYASVWSDTCAEVVGKDKAEAACDQLRKFCDGTIYGLEAEKAYKDREDAALFDCHFINGVVSISFNGDKISGVDKDGKQVFSHSYSFVGYDKDTGFYEYKSKDKNEDEFTYFCLLPDTPATTYHIEFRYGKDLKALMNYKEGNYAYWMAAGILKDADQLMITNSIKLFCTENLSE